MLAGIREVLIISTPHDLPPFRRCSATGRNGAWPSNYAVQPEPDGLAQAFIIGADFVAGEPSALILGDNIFFGHGLPELLGQRLHRARPGRRVFAYHVADPERYGVVELRRPR